MSDQKTSRARLVDFLLMFIGVFLLLQLGTRWLFPQEPAGGLPPVVVAMESAKLRLGHHPSLVVTNNATSGLTLPARCPNAPVDVVRIAADGLAGTPLTATETAVPCPEAVVVQPGQKVTVSLAPWKYAYFSEAGTYDVRLPEALAQAAGSGAVTSARITMTEPGVFVQAFRALVTKPLLNLLVLIASVMPGHNLGLSIILLTVAVKLLLYLPTQHALEGQRKMQLLQPKMEELRRQYKGDPQKINAETMKLWKENDVNPFQSCLPLLLQFPVLIGLFYVIRDGSVLSLAREFLYASMSDIDLHFGTSFLGLDLMVPNWTVFPALLVAMQFGQMWLTFHIAKRKKKDDEKKADPAMEAQQKVMLYVLPLMIGVFAFQFPAAVSLYWAVSTVFGIGQQLLVNRKVLVS